MIRFSVYTNFVLIQDKAGDILKKRIVDQPKLNIIGDRVREARLRAGLSQSALSQRLELHAVYVCRGSLSRIENGERAVTDIEIAALSKVLGVSLDVLFGNKDL